jgi:radical SAM superfamily enzyme YgiQ (UPF0313 family)
MKIYDFVFAYFNVLDDILTGAEYQLDCAYIRAYLNKNGCFTMQYIDNVNLSHYNYINAISNLATHNYVFFINEYNYYISKIVINKLKQIKSGINICIIGPSVNYISYNFPYEISFDVAVFRHSHVALEMICNLKKNEYSIISNICYKQKNTVYFTDKEEYEYSLDTLGLPYSEKLIPPEEIGNVGMMTSIGCYGNCIFCSYNAKPNIFRLHSIDNVIKELDYVSQYCRGNDITVRFFDDCFSVNPARTLELLQTISRREFDFSFWCCLRADLLNEDIIDYLHKCNFSRIVIGLETASKNVIQNLGKVQIGDTPESFYERFTRVYSYAREKKISPMFSVNFGLPYETFQDAYRTIEFIFEQKAVADISVCFMTCFPGSSVFEDSEAYLIEKEISPTKMPLRTFYKHYDMKQIFNQLYDSKIISKSIDRIIDSASFYYRMVFSGLFFEYKLSYTIDAIFVDVINDENMKFIDKNISIVGNIFILNMSLKVDINAFADERKKLKLCIPQYDKNLNEAYKNDLFLPNQNFYKVLEDKVVLQRSNLYLGKPINIELDDFCVLRDMRVFEETFASFEESNVIEIKLVAKLSFINSCMIAGKCTLCDLNRIRIEGSSLYAVCSKTLLGKIQDDYDKIKKYVVKYSDLIFSQRGCGGCEVNKWCPKCVSPQDIWGSASNYCKYMKRDKDFLLFMKLLGKLYIFYSENNSLINQKVSAYFLGSEKISVAGKYIFNDSTVLVLLNGNSYIINLYTHDVINCREFERDCLLSIIDANVKKRDMNLNSINISSFVKKDVFRYI